LLAIGLIIGAVRLKHVSGAPGFAEVEVVQMNRRMSRFLVSGSARSTDSQMLTSGPGHGLLQRQGYQEGACSSGKVSCCSRSTHVPFRLRLTKAEGQLAQAKAALANAQGRAR